MGSQQREQSNRPAAQGSAEPVGEQQAQASQGDSGSGLSQTEESAVETASRQPFTGGPFALLRRVFEDMDRIFDDMLGRSWRQPQTQWPFAVWAPQVELAERDDELVVRVDLPGTREQDIRIEVLDNALAIEGERRSEREETRENVFRSERAYGGFRRVVPLPDGADTDDATASFEGGVLEIRVKLPAPRQNRRQLEIKPAGQDAGAESRPH